MVNIINLERANEMLVKGGFQPITKGTLLFYYAPMKGWISYTMLAGQMMSPELYQDFSLRIVGIPQYISLTNACLLNSLVGTALYFYSRPHLQRALPKDRLLYCAFGSTFFNLGSMLTWALGRTVAPESPALRLVLGIGGAIAVLYIGKKYTDHVDSQVNSPE